MFYLYKTKLAIILTIAFFFRLIWSIYIGVDPVSDSYIYRAFAWSIAEGRGYAYPDGNQTAYWAVGPSALYATAMNLFGNTAAAAVAPNLISGLLLIVFTYLVAKHQFGEKTAITAAGLLAFWPVLIQFSTVYASEIHFSTLIVWSIYALQQHNTKPILQGMYWGTILALACYMRPTAMPFFALFPIAQYLINRKYKPTIYSTLAAASVAFVLIAPWAMRNHALLGEYVPISANFGTNLWMGNNPNSDGGYTALPDTSFENELKRDQFYKNIAINYIKTDPMRYFLLSLKRTYISFSRETIGVVWNEPSLSRMIGPTGVKLAKILSSIYWIVFFLISLMTCLYLLWKKLLPIYSPLVVTPVVFIAIPILTVGQDRYHMALIPFIAMFAAYFITQTTAKRLVFREHAA